MSPSSPSSPPAQSAQSAALQSLAQRIAPPNSQSPFCTPGVLLVAAPLGGAPAPAVVVGTDGKGVPLEEDTLFPLASASKLAVGLALLTLVDGGLLELDAPLARYVPEARAAREGVTVRRLLNHTSGLSLEIPPGSVAIAPDLTWRAIARACCAVDLTALPGAGVQYSNVGYGLLGIAAERLTGQRMADLLRERVFQPLGIEAYFGERELPREPAYVTGIDSSYVGTPLEPINSAFSRGLCLPWAGVVTTIHGLLALLRAYADAAEGSGHGSAALLSPSLMREVLRDSTGGVGGGFVSADPFLAFNGSRPIAWPVCPWGLAVELRGEKRPHWTPASASPASFGQIGSSGCLAWCDPDRRVAWAVMGTRTTDSGWLLRHGAAIGDTMVREIAMSRDVAG